MYTAYLKGSLKLSQTGEWWHNGVPFSNPKLIDLFSRSIVWDEELKEYFIQIGQQRASFDCEDTAYFVAALDLEAKPCKILLSDGSSEELLTDTLSLGSEKQIYCVVKGQHLARFSRGAHQVLLQLVSSDAAITIDGKKIKVKER